MFVHSALLVLHLFGMVSVSIVDTNGQPIPGVTLLLSAPDRSVHAASDALGHADVGPLPPGNYVLKAELAEFRSREFLVSVEPGRISSLSVPLEIETILVGCCLGCEPIMIDPQSSSVGVRLFSTDVGFMPWP